MSFIRPTWLDDVIKPAPSASPRLRGLKAFEPHHVPAFQDPLYADDPTFWVLASELAAAATFLGHVGVQVPLDDSLIVTVDDATISAPTADRFDLYGVLGGQVQLLLNTDTGVWKRNRRELSRTTAVERAGLLRITDNANAFTGTLFETVRLAANTPYTLPINWRIYGGEQLFIANATANQALTVTMRGRLTTKGQR